MRIILLGAPGSGKGTAAESIRSAYGFPKISTGDLLRDAVRKRTPLGLKAGEQMGRGGLVDDATVMALLNERLAAKDCRKGYTLDGFPRNLAQAKSLEQTGGSGPEVVFELKVDESVVLRRLTNRRTCPSCEAIFHLVSKPPLKDQICDVCGSELIQRDDDRAEVVIERLKTYRAKTEPLIAHYKAKGTLFVIDGGGTAEAAFARIREVLEAVVARAPRGRG